MSDVVAGGTAAKPYESGVPFGEWALTELEKIRDETITIEKMREFLGTVLEWAKTRKISLDEMESQLFDALFGAGISIGEMPVLEERGSALYGELDLGGFAEKISATC